MKELDPLYTGCLHGSGVSSDGLGFMSFTWGLLEVELAAEINRDKKFPDNECSDWKVNIPGSKHFGSKRQ